MVGRFLQSLNLPIKKESPNEGTETGADALIPSLSVTFMIKKESPNEGTETVCVHVFYKRKGDIIKKESPNEGTETCL